MGKQKVKIRRLNWDVEFYKDLITGNGFKIMEPSGVSIDGVKKKSMYGAMSPLYGTNYEDEQSFIERYRCSCGEFKGRQFEGEECPICHTKVEYRSSNINITGWITLGTKRIINPYYFNVLQNAIGKNIFTEMIFAKYIVTTDGQRRRVTPDDLTDKEPESIYSFIGVDGFFEKYEEILTYFKAKKKHKAHVFDTLLKQKRAVFTSSIPVYSTMLRPQSVTSDTFYFGGIDKHINTAYSLSENLKNCIDVEEDFILQRLQGKVNKMWDMNLDLINGKEGWIRDQLLGGSLNFTSRKFYIATYYSDIIFKPL